MFSENYVNFLTKSYQTVFVNSWQMSQPCNLEILDYPSETETVNQPSFSETLRNESESLNIPSELRSLKNFDSWFNLYNL